MDPLTIGLIGSGVGALGNFFSSIWNTRQQDKANQQNLELQREQWAREDNSITRMAEELKANNLSKVFASGSGLPSTLSTKVQAPQFSGDLQKALDMFSVYQQFKSTDAQIANVNADTENKTIENQSLAERNSVNLSILRSEAGIKALEGQYAQEKISSGIQESIAKAFYFSQLGTNKEYENKYADTYFHWRNINASEQYSLSKLEEGLKQGQIDLNAQEIANISSMIAYRTLQGQHVSQQTRNLVQDLANSELQHVINSYNYMYSRSEHLRTTDGLPTSSLKLGGFSVSGSTVPTSNMFKEAIKAPFNFLTNNDWHGLLSPVVEKATGKQLPSFKDIFGWVKSIF